MRSENARPGFGPGRQLRRALGGSVALVLLFAAVDCYRYDDHAFADGYVSVAGGEVEVSLTGSHTPDGQDRGNPYHLRVRYVTRDTGVVRAELVSASIPAALGKLPVAIRADSLRPVDGDIGWRSAEAPAPGSRYAAFLVGTAALPYSDQVVTGRLRLIGASGAREVPFTATLRPAPHSELRSRVWDRAGSV